MRCRPAKCPAGQRQRPAGIGVHRLRTPERPAEDAALQGVSSDRRREADPPQVSEGPLCPRKGQRSWAKSTDGPGPARAVGHGQGTSGGGTSWRRARARWGAKRRPTSQTAWKPIAHSSSTPGPRATVTRNPEAIIWRRPTEQRPTPRSTSVRARPDRRPPGRTPWDQRPDTRRAAGRSLDASGRPAR